MIFVTLGTQKFPFDRLLRQLDALAQQGAITEPVLVQSGYSSYQPRHLTCRPFMAREEFVRVMAQAELVIAHGGTGAIVGALKLGKKVLAVPRLAKYGEHVDDHQCQIVEAFSATGLLCACYEGDDLLAQIEKTRRSTFAAFHSNTEAFLAAIDEDIQNL